MIAILFLSIITLVNIIIEKREELKEKSKWTKPAKIIYISGVVAILCISGYKQITSDSDQDNHYNGKDPVGLQQQRMSDKIDTMAIVVANFNKFITPKTGISVKDSSGVLVVVNNNSYNYNYYQNTMPCRIRIEVSDTPNRKMQTLCNGDIIPLQYKPNKDHMGFIVPYLVGKEMASVPLLGGQGLPDMIFNKNTGNFDLTVNGGIYNGTVIELSVNVPIDTRTSKKIDILKDCTTLKDEFFSKPITSISQNGQSITSGQFFTQDLAKKTITVTSGLTMFSSGPAVAYR